MCRRRYGDCRMIGHRAQVRDSFPRTSGLLVMDSDTAVSIECPAPLNSQPSLAEQLFDAVNQPSDGKRFDQVLHVMLGEEKRYFRVGGETGYENEAIC
jgi:hypothetical protein